MSLFGNTAGTGSGRGGGSTGASKNLVEFKAGKMTLRDRMVHPDKRKGTLYIQQSDDGLMHLCWRERNKSNPEDDLIIFPDDAEYRHVPQCTTGRVYVLKFKTSNRKLFFWLQEPKTDKDEENCQKVNDLLNNPPAPGSARGGNSGGGGGIPGLPAEFASLGDSPDLHNLLSSMNQQQLMQLISGMGGMGGSLSSLMSGATSGRSSATSVASTLDSTPGTRAQSSAGARATTTTSAAPATAAATTAATAAGQDSSSSSQPQQRIQLSDLQNILSSFGASGGSEPKEVDLSETLNRELLIPLLAKPEIQERLVPYLPQGEALPRSEEELRQTIHSPQFQQAVRGFSAAFSSGQLGPLIAQFNLGDEAVAAANSGDMCAFAKALQDAADKKKKEESGGESSDKKMDVDDDQQTSSK